MKNEFSREISNHLHFFPMGPYIPPKYIVLGESKVRTITRVTHIMKQEVSHILHLTSGTT